MVKTEYRDMGSYLYVTSKGSWSEKDVPDELGAIRDHAVEMEIYRILMNCYELAPPTVEYDRFVVGKVIASLFTRPFKMAVTYPVEFITGFAEDTAVNRGAKLLITPSEEEAIEWLLMD